MARAPVAGGGPAPAALIHPDPPPAGYHWVNLGGAVVLEPIVAPTITPADTTTSTTPKKEEFKMEKIVWPIAIVIIAFLAIASYHGSWPFGYRGGEVAGARVPGTPGMAPHNKACNPCPAGYGHYGRRPGSPCWCTRS